MGARVTTRLASDPAPFLTRMPWPEGTPISQEFGAMDSGYPHRGRDGAVVVGTPIVSPAPGTVVDFVNSWTTWNGESVRSFGNGVCIDYGNGLFGLTAHFSRVDVALGDKVAAGQQIGLSGNTGVSTGPHCHYQICTNTSFPVDISYSRDPRDFYDPNAGGLTVEDKARLDRVERLLIGNGTLAIRRPDASGANYTQWFADEIASKGAGGLPEVDKRGTPTGRVARSIGDVPVTPEGSSGPMYVLTGERALQYADARGFSLGQAVESLL